MRTLKFFLMIVGIIGIAMAFQSCLDDDDNDWELRYPNALVTVSRMEETLSSCNLMTIQHYYLRM